MIRNLIVELEISNDSFQTFGSNKKSEKNSKSMYHIKKIRNCIRSMFIIKFKSIEIIF